MVLVTPPTPKKILLPYLCGFANWFLPFSPQRVSWQQVSSPINMKPWEVEMEGQNHRAWSLTFATLQAHLDFWLPGKASVVFSIQITTPAEYLVHSHFVSWKKQLATRRQEELPTLCWSGTRNGHHSINSPWSRWILPGFYWSGCNFCLLESPLIREAGEAFVTSTGCTSHQQVYGLKEHIGTLKDYTHTSTPTTDLFTIWFATM